MNRPSLRFLTLFLASLAFFSLFLQMEMVHRLVTIPITGIVARASGLLLALLGIENVVSGTLIEGSSGFTVNILDGCNGMDVIAIVAAAVLSFPATWRQKGLGLLLGIPGVQALNILRIVSLYWLGLNRSDLFESFHLYVWQAGVILFSLGLWLFWAEVIVRGPDRRRARAVPPS